MNSRSGKALSLCGKAESASESASDKGQAVGEATSSWPWPERMKRPATQDNRSNIWVDLEEGAPLRVSLNLGLIAYLRASIDLKVEYSLRCCWQSANAMVAHAAQGRSAGSRLQACRICLVAAHSR